MKARLKNFRSFLVLVTGLPLPFLTLSLALAIDLLSLRWMLEWFACGMRGWRIYLGGRGIFGLVGG